MCMQFGTETSRTTCVCGAAWLQVSDGVADVRVVVKAAGDFIHAGGVAAKSGCWSMLKGGLTTVSGGRAEIYFEVTN